MKNNYFDQFDRPFFDLWFMTQCFLVAQRSLDPASKCGTVIVDESNSILAVGYNSPPRGCVDEIVPLTRPEKYSWMAHGEINAITNAARTGVCLNGSTFYVTGPPCVVCFRSILNSGAKRLVYGPNHTKCVADSDDEIVKRRMVEDPVKYGLKKRDFQIDYFGDFEAINQLLQNTSNYIYNKINEE
jgi:dCMP deaminase